MALFRLRRALTLSSTVLKDSQFSSISSRPSPLFSPKPQSPLIGSSIPKPYSLISSQFFRSSSASSIRRNEGFEESKIDPDEILFEGCDYNHWLITIDFPRDPENKPTPEQMVETYVQTAAQVFGSVEEAKKRIYACSTTTYQGFQVLCDEATSEKFRGLPGVVFILPDSYIDPVNKEYGGDKYENGVITPRPPPVQYGRQGRYGDRNRNFERQPRFDRPRDSMPPQQGAGGYGGPPPQGAGGYGGPPKQDGRGYGPPQQGAGGYGGPPQRGAGDYGGPPKQDGRGYGPPQQGAGVYGAPQQQDGRGYAPQQHDGRGYAPQRHDGRGFGQEERRDYAGGQGYPAGGRDGYQGGWRDQMPPHRGGFHQGQGNLPPQPPRNFSQVPGGDGAPVSREFRQPPPSYGYGGDQGQGSGYK